jgi:hypothetical protein
MATKKTPLQSFEDKALKQFTKEITDIFFLYIENDPELMHDYLRLIGREGNLDTTNMKLGRAVKSWFHLDDIKETPANLSLLIESYMEHKKGK